MRPHAPTASTLIIGLLLVARTAAAQSLLLPNMAAPDGPVYASAAVGTTLLIGGTFHSVGPVTGGGFSVNTGGSLLPGPKIEGNVKAVAPDGAGGWYIGGSFTRVGGVARTNLAYILADGSVSSWNPGANASVRCLLLSGGTLYVGGSFTSVAGVTRNRLAAVSATTGALTAWDPGASDEVVAFASSGSTLFVGGRFLTAGGQGRNRLAAFDLGTGALTGWNPNANADVLSLAMRPGNASVYVGGGFTSVGGQSRSLIAELNVSDGAATAWNPGNPNSAGAAVKTIGVNGSTIYVGGIFTAMGGASRYALAALDATTGAATSWNPGPTNWVESLAVSGSTVYVAGSFSTIAGAIRYHLAALDATLDTNNALAWSPPVDGDVTVILVQGSAIYVGGMFTSGGGQLRDGVAEIDTQTGALMPWNPDTEDPQLGTLRAYAVATNSSGSTVYVAGQWQGSGTGAVFALDGSTGATLWTRSIGGAVYDLELVGTTLYLGGSFTDVRTPSPVTRNHLAALDAATGNLLAWDPNADGTVRAMVLNGGILYLGGDFTAVGGLARNHLAAIDLGTTAVQPWDPNANGTVFALAVQGSLVYVGGSFTSVGGQPRSYLAAIGSDGFIYPWAPTPSAYVTSVLPSGGSVTFGGHFISVAGRTRYGLARVEWPTGRISSWDPGINSIQGAALCVTPGSSAFYVGGDFQGIGGTGYRPYIAAFTATDAGVPDVSIAEGNSNQIPVFVSVSLSAASADTVRVNWTTENGTALAGSDYVAASGTVTFLPGQTTQTLTVNVIGDQLSEPDETFNIHLTSASFANAHDDIGVVTILDDEPVSVVCKDFPATDGVVHTAVTSGGTLYLGGEFTTIGPATGGAAPLDPATGVALAVPRVNGIVRAVAPDGAGGWYLGGQFTKVGGIGRLNLAHVRADHSVTEWTPNANGSVETILVNGSTVYVGGVFTSVGGQPRNRVAALDAATGTATPWNPNASGPVHALALDGSTLYVAGGYASIGGASRRNLAAINTATGAAEAWNPDPDNVVWTVLANGGTLYAGGAFTLIGGQTRNRIAQLSLTTGLATAWNPNANGSVLAMAIEGVRLYAGGSFSTMGGVPKPSIAAIDLVTGTPFSFISTPNGTVNAIAVSGERVYMGGSFTTVAGLLRSGLASVDAAGTLSSWDPHPSGGLQPTVYALLANDQMVYAGGWFELIGGQQRSNLAAVNLQTSAVTGWNPGATGAVRALVVRGGAIYVGGDFTRVGATVRNYLAALDSTTAEPTAWNPNPNQFVKSLALSANGALLVGGSFTSIAGQTRNRIAAFDGGNTLKSWNPNANGDVLTFTPNGSTIYVGGGFTQIGGQFRPRIAALDSTTGLASTWNPNANGNVLAIRVAPGLVYAAGEFGTIGGFPRGSLAALSATTGQATNWNVNADGPISAIVLDGTTIFAGGRFGNIGGQARSFVGAVSTQTGLATAWNPGADGPVETLLAQGGRTYVGGSFAQVAGLPASGIACTVPLESVDAPLPGPVGELALAPLRPNPARGTTLLEYALPEAAQVRIDVYDLQGRLRARPIDGWSPAGRHGTAWDPRANGLAPGLYYVRLTVGDRRLTRTLVLLH